MTLLVIKRNPSLYVFSVLAIVVSYAESKKQQKTVL